MWECARKKKEFFEMVGRMASVMRSRIASKGKRPGPAFPHMAFQNEQKRQLQISNVWLHFDTNRTKLVNHVSTMVVEISEKHVQPDSDLWAHHKTFR